MRSLLVPLGRLCGILIVGEMTPGSVGIAGLILA